MLIIVRKMSEKELDNYIDSLFVSYEQVLQVQQIDYIKDYLESQLIDYDLWKNATYDVLIKIVNSIYPVIYL